MIDVDAIHREIMAGLPNSLMRRDRALRAHEFASGCFDRYRSREPRGDSRYERTSLFMRRVVDVLSGLLYREGPRRSLPDHPQAEEWLAEIYRRNGVDAILQAADRATFISDVALIQVEPSTDSDVPVQLRLWEAAWFEVWFHPDDAMKIGAVATIDVHDHSRRLRLWTDTEVREYRTQRWDERTKTSGATAYSLVSSDEHSLGVVPFVSIHHDIPTTTFWTQGPGDSLADTNDWINKRLTDTFDSVRANLDPVLIMKHVEAGWPMPKAAPGLVINPPARLSAGGEAMGEPGAEYLQANPDFVGAAWEDLNFAIEHTLEMAGVAPSEVRMIQDAARSGAALVAEQIPAVNRARARQRKAAVEEDRLASVVLAVGAAHLGNPANLGLVAGASPAMLEVASRSPGISLAWPDLWPRIPGTESDQADQWMLDNGLTSRVHLLMARNNMTETEAEAHLRDVVEKIRAERVMFEGGGDVGRADQEPKRGNQQAELAVGDSERGVEAEEGDDP